MQRELADYHYVKVILYGNIIFRKKLEDFDNLLKSSAMLYSEKLLKYWSNTIFKLVLISVVQNRCIYCMLIVLSAINNC